MTSPILEKSPEALLHPLYFKKYINVSAIKLSQDQCYSEKTRKEFDGYEVSLDDANETYQYIRDVLGEFKGDAEKFYPKFYKCVPEVVFKNLSPRSSVLLGCEVANHVLAHLTGSKVKDSLVEFPTPSYSIKEMTIIKYLSGYVFGTIYRRIRRSKSTQSMLGIQSLSILLSGKSSLQNSSADSDLLIPAKDRGGLWNVTADVLAIFVQVETTFRQSTTHLGHKIDSKMMVSQLMENPSVLCNFNKVRNQSVEKVSKEIALNLLMNISLHCMFVYVHFLWQKIDVSYINITSKRKKKRSLRTEIKKASNSFDQQH